VEAGSDPHPKVKDSAKAAMQDISSVIRNPEISRISPFLLAALVNTVTLHNECTYVCMYVCMYGGGNKFIYVCMYGDGNKFMYICMYI
jgi:hypothetical protein